MSLTFSRPSLPRQCRAATLIGIVVVVLGGCASPRSASESGPAETAEAEQEIARARQAVREARTVGAEMGAAAEFESATTRLSEAQDALAAGDAEAAVRRALEAEADGRLAELTVLAARADARRALYREVRALRVRVDSAQSIR